MYILVLIAVSVCLLEKAVTVGAQTCYFPDGSVAGRDTPCRAPTSDQASACCDFTEVCLDNNLCLNQEGNELVTRGTCTDQQWQSGDCPQFCQDVNPNWGIGIFPFPFLDGSTFCCGLGNSVTNQCVNSTRGSSAPFPVQAGRVIYNRTSGSTSPNMSETVSVTVTVTASAFAFPSISDTVTLTVTFTATVTTTVTTSRSALPTSSDVSIVTVTSTTAPSSTVVTSSNPKTCRDSPSSSNKPAAVGFGVGAPLGVALLGAFALIQRQKTREVGARKEALDARREARGARKEARAWEKKYDELQKDLNGTRGQMYELGHEGWRGRGELDGRRI